MIQFMDLILKVVKSVHTLKKGSLPRIKIKQTIFVKKYYYCSECLLHTMNGNQTNLIKLLTIIDLYRKTDKSKKEWCWLKKKVIDIVLIQM